MWDTLHPCHSKSLKLHSEEQDKAILAVHYELWPGSEAAAVNLASIVDDLVGQRGWETYFPLATKRD